MTYFSRGEKIFSLKDPINPDCTPPVIKRSDHRLKRFFSTFDRRAWNFCEAVRYRHLYDLLSGSQTCLGGAGDCHRYVPLEDLIRILLAEKDAYIRELEEKLRRCCGSQMGGQFGETGKSGESAEAKNLHMNEISVLSQELNNSREMLRKAMQKLQNIDEIVNENKKLHCRLRCSEEKIKYLQDRKRRLECELADLRSRSQIQIDLDKAQEMLCRATHRKNETSDEETLRQFALEREELKKKVEKLEKELEESKKKENELEMLKNQSRSTDLDVEEMSRENECYRKKLVSMKCLEKQIQELKKQGRALADKYRRESQKASEQMSKMCQAAKELQCLREERDSLRKRVDELSSFECQYKVLQRKLKCVEGVIAENDMLNCKLMALDELEKENEYLRCKLDQIQEMEINAAEDKERILQLQCAVADQEEEMKNLLCQIKKLTSGRNEEELERLKCELYDKNSKLKLCEEQLAEIPMLEAEIDELRVKLQNCCQEFSEKKTYENRHQRIEIRFPAASKEISAKYKNQESSCLSVSGTRRDDKTSPGRTKSDCREISQVQSSKSYPCSDSFDNKETMSCDEVQSLLQSSKEIITCVLEDMIEHQKEMEELESCNREMKDEILMLKCKIGNSDDVKVELNNCKKALEERNKEIVELKQGKQSSSSAAVSNEELETLRELNKQMKSELEAACVGLSEIAKLEKLLEMERDARCRAERMLKEMDTRGNVTSDQEDDFDCCKVLQKEIDHLKLQIAALNKLTEELKKENELLRELQQPCPDLSKELDERCALENLLSLLQAELDAFKGQKLSDECEALRNELKRVMEQNCQLKALLDCYRQRLDLEKKSTLLTQTKVEEEGPLEEKKKADFFEKPVPMTKPEAEVESVKEKIKQEKEEPGEKLEEEKIEGYRETEVAEKKKIEDLEPTKEEVPKRFPVVKEETGVKKPFEAPSKEIPSLGVDKSEDRPAPAKVSPSKALEPEKKLESTVPETVKEIVPPQPPTLAEAKPSPPPAAALPEPPAPPQKTQQPSPAEPPPPPPPPPVAPAPPPPTPAAPVAPAPPAPTPAAPVAPAPPAPTPAAPVAPAPPAPTPAAPVAAAPVAAAPEPPAPIPAPPAALPPAPATISDAGEKDLLSEIERLKKLLAEKDALLDDQKRKCEDDLKALKAENKRLEDDKNQLQNSLREVEGSSKAPVEKAVQPEINDLLKQLEELKKEKNDMATQLAIASSEKGVTPQKEPPSVAAPSVPDSDCEQRLKDLERENAEKLKKLMEQHEKELANREKAYNDNLNAMKSGYETDIRKMADRHKQSIMRLQGLHEDEVQELNTTHENQMETIQTQSQGAINDVTKGSAAKMRRLSQQHEKELKAAEAKYLQEIDGLRKSLTKSLEEMEALRKKGDEAAQKQLASLKDKHDREMQQMRRSSMKRMSLMKTKYEKTLEEEKKKSEVQMETLQKKLKEQAQGDGVCDCKLAVKKFKKPRDPTCPLDFNEVLEKILEQGIDSLTFNEIALVHRKACCALQGMMMNSKIIPCLEPPVGDACIHTPVLQADKQQLLNRIVALENEIVTKQKQTQEAIISMEVAVKKERCRLQELKNLLQSEQQKNLELKSLLTSQTKIQSDLRKERDTLGTQASLHQSLCQEKTKQLDQEKKDKKYLEEEIERLRCKVHQLCAALDAARGVSDYKQKKDLDQLQTMRRKLEQSANQEHRLAMQLQNEAKYRIQLQCQLQALKQSFQQMVDLPAVERDIKLARSPLESKYAKEKKNLDQIRERKSKTKSKFVKKHKK